MANVSCEETYIVGGEKVPGVSGAGKVEKGLAYHARLGAREKYGIG